MDEILVFCLETFVWLSFPLQLQHAGTIRSCGLECDCDFGVDRKKEYGSWLKSISGCCWKRSSRDGSFPLMSSFGFS
jgi:hypothetical protein